MNESLIYGRDQTKGIVSIEINEDTTELFIQQDDGSVISEFRPNRYWVLAHNQLNNKFKRLEGDLFYRYIALTGDKKLFQDSRRLWKNKDIYSIYNSKEAYMVLNGSTYFKGLKHNQVSILSFDIETMGLTHDKQSNVLLISNTFRDSQGKVTRKLFAYDEYESTGHMLNEWCAWVREMNPSIMCGHNIFGYDLPYMQFVADKENISLNLGRDNSELTFNKYSSQYRVDGSRSLEYKSASIYGREIIDTMFLSYKYGVTKNYESYGLKSLIKAEKLEIKDRVFYDAGQIRFKYKDKKEWAFIKEYAKHDADDALALFDLMSPSQFYWSQVVPKSFQSVVEGATGSQINSILMRAYLQDGHGLPATSHIDGFQGALSYAKPSVYTNHIRFDVAGLYPSIVVQYKLFDKAKDPKGYYYELTKALREERLKHKALAKQTGEKYYKDLEQSEKIGVNSIYGTAGAPRLLFNSPKVADDITRYGREILMTAVEWASGKKFNEFMPTIVTEVDDE